MAERMGSGSLSPPLPRCYSFGIGPNVCHRLVRGLATVSKGSAEFLMEGERLQPKVGGRAPVPLLLDPHSNTWGKGGPGKQIHLLKITIWFMFLTQTFWVPWTSHNPPLSPGFSHL